MPRGASLASRSSVAPAAPAAPAALATAAFASSAHATHSADRYPWRESSFLDRTRVAECISSDPLHDFLRSIPCYWVRHHAPPNPADSRLIALIDPQAMV